MNIKEVSLEEYFANEARSIAEACTRCGKCVEVCPVIPFGQAAASPPRGVVSGVVDFLSAAGSPGADAGTWMSTCNGCGACIPACPEGVNPRKMLILAASKAATIESRTPDLFRRMSRAIKVMVAMQLLPAEFRRLFVPPRPRNVPIVFYLGCNALRTPHLLFNSMQLLDALDVDYEVVGGPSSCCGVIAAKWEGEVAVGERVTGNTIARFEGFSPGKVLNWCPTCALHLGETLSGYRKTSFDFDHLTTYLVANLDRLRARFVRPVAKRVVLHAHVGCGDIGANVAQLLAAIPGLDLIGTEWESGYTCGGSGCSKSPGLAAREHAALLETVRDAGADALVTLYHGCHSVFLGAEKEGRFEVLNFTDLLVGALGGTPHEDRLKKLRLMDDWQMIVEDARPFLEANGLEIDGAWLAKYGPQIFASAEFRGEMECFGNPG